MKTLVLAIAVAAGLASGGAAAEIHVDADWSATIYSTLDGSSFPTGGAVAFDEPYAPFPPYAYQDGIYTVTLETPDFVTDSGGMGAVGITGPDAYGVGTWEGTWVLIAVPEPADVALMLAGLGLIGAAARRSERRRRDDRPAPWRGSRLDDDVRRGA